MAKEDTSVWYWLLPILFNWIGGLTGWLVLKDKDREKADNILVSGLVILGLEILTLTIWIGGLMF